MKIVIQPGMPGQRRGKDIDCDRQDDGCVLTGKEDIKIERVPIPVWGRRSLVKVHCAHLRHGSEGVSARYHARMIVPPRCSTRTSRHDRTGWRRRRGFKKGMRVVALNSAPCGMCFIAPSTNSTSAKICCSITARMRIIRIPKRIVEANMLVVPSNVTFEDAAMTEPLACVLRGLHETASRSRNVVVIAAAPSPDVCASGQSDRLQRDCGGQARFASRTGAQEGRARSRADHQSERCGRGGARTESGETRRRRGH